MLPRVFFVFLLFDRCLHIRKTLVCAVYAQAYGRSSAPPGGGRLLVVVLEEVDRLLSRGKANFLCADDIYKLFMLPYTDGIQCMALVAVANSLDLTERLLPALKQRAASPEHVCFPAYSKTQVWRGLQLSSG